MTRKYKSATPHFAGQAARNDEQKTERWQHKKSNPITYNLNAMIKNYIKTAIRNLWKNKTYSFLNIFGLATGTACAGFIFLWVEDEFNYNHNNVKIDQVYQVLENQAYEGKVYTFSATPGP